MSERPRSSQGSLPERRDRDREHAGHGNPPAAIDGAKPETDALSSFSRDSAPRISAVVLTYNEERHLPDCLASLEWADEILVLDSGSEDATREIAAAAGARVEVRPFENYSIQRQHGLDLATHPWLLFVDADERVSAELAEEIRRVLAASSGPDPEAETATVGYWIPRRNRFFGRALKGGGWWPDHQLRLLRVDAARYDARREVHEVAELEGASAFLQHPLVHINYETLPEFLKKQEAYARLDLRKRAALGQRVRPHNLILQPLREGWRRFVRLGGWRDGLLGLFLACAMAGFELRTLVGLARHRRALASLDR